MIYLTDLSVLMQRTIAQGITFMISQSGCPDYYNLYFAKYIDGIGNQSTRLYYHETEGLVLQYADKKHPIVKMNSIDEVIEFVIEDLITDWNMGK